MNNKQLKETAKKHEPAKHAGKHALIAFLSGGALGAAAQLLMRIYMMERFLERVHTPLTSHLRIS